MPHAYHDIAFTPGVKALQERHGSRTSYARFETGGLRNGVIGPREAAFIGARDSFYMATVSETGWPYMQHRGGPAGFLRVLDGQTIGFADFAGNRQYVSAGNIAANDRVSLFLMDYANRTRLKILGHARIVSASDPGVLAKLTDASYDAAVERGVLIAVAGFDWNCPQHITSRFSVAELEALGTLEPRSQ